MNKTLLFFTFLFLSHGSIAQIYVKVNGTGDGTSWASPLGNLSDALNTASQGSAIWVAKGIYSPTQCSTCSKEDRDKSFHIPNGVVVLGGFAGTETNINQRNWESHPTILSGDIDRDGSIANNSYTVVTTNNVNETTTVDGFTITGGFANGSEGSLEINRQSGGGWFNGSIANSTSNPTIRNCIFRENEVVAFGGAMYNFGSFGGESSPIYINCKFISNRCGYDGGAVYNNGSFNGKSRSIFEHCQFENNFAGRIIGSGAAIYNNGIEGMASPDITACSFYQNHSTLNGGAIYNQGKRGQSSPKIVNSVFYQNTSVEGGAMYNLGAEEGQSNPSIINCTFYDNYAENGAALLNNGWVDGTSSPRISNSIIWGNRALAGSVFFNIYGTPYLEYCLVEAKDCEDLNQHYENDFSSVNCGEGLLFEEAKPKFVKASEGDLHLKFNSKAVNKGRNHAINETYDLDLKPRISLGQIDMGAYEYDGPLPTKMDSFRVENKEEYIQIEWNTLREYQNAGFQLQRSLDDEPFETLAFIEGIGNADTPQFYDFQDTDMVPRAIHAYRLQRLDVDGCYEFSNIDTTYVEIIETSVVVWPNPTSLMAYIALSLEEEMEVNLELVNSYGQKELIINDVLPRGQQVISIDVSDKSDGIYCVWLTMKKERFSYPFVVVRL